MHNYSNIRGAAEEEWTRHTVNAIASWPWGPEKKNPGTIYIYIGELDSLVNQLYKTHAGFEILY